MYGLLASKVKIRNSVILLLFFIYGGLLKAQMLDVRQPLFSDIPFFRISFIRQNHIKAIKGTISTKKINDIIHSLGNRHVYLFDTLGRLSMQYKINNLGYGKLDTLTTAYIYDAKQRLKEIRYNDDAGYYAYQYEYDSLNRVIKKSYIRVENTSGNALEFIPGKEIVISSETNKYLQLTPFQFKKITYNNYEKAYKYQIFTYDIYHYLLSKSTHFINGGNHSAAKYSYNKKGLVMEEETENETGKKSLKYQYDDSGNLLQIDVYVDGNHKTIKQYLYRPKTYLMYAQLEQDVPTKTIIIRQYDFEFYGQQNADSTQSH